MSPSRHGNEMTGAPGVGSVRRARERAQAGLPREESEFPVPPPSVRVQASPNSSPKSSPSRGASAVGQSRIPRPQAQTQQNNSLPISRPTQVPQWPLPGPIRTVGSTGSEPYQPPPGRSQPPQRPPRPSQVPSILDGSRIQDHTPVFQYTSREELEPNQNQEFSTSVPPTPSSRHTQSSVASSVGSIPDFPMPLEGPSTTTQSASAPPRKSANLGPPPSARRGASSFYSNASFVSPIPEESPRSRSQYSYASSAAMPASWGAVSPRLSPGLQDGSHLESAIDEETSSLRSTSQHGDEGDESRLVRSASIGKRGKAAIVMNRGTGGEQTSSSPPNRLPSSTRPGPTPMQEQGDPFHDRSAYLDVSSSSSGALPTLTATAAPLSPTSDALLGAYAAASSADPADARKATPSPQPFGSRRSVLKRPPKLDIDSVRAMEARGSITSLPDLIRRATQLASMMDRGKRPASRLDNLNDWPDEKTLQRNLSGDERHRSGFSDMLAAFPPPAGTPGPTRNSRGSWFRRSTSSWPLAPSRGQTPQGISGAQATHADGSNTDAAQDMKKRRRCCGLPLWAFILILALLLLIVAAAVVLPLYFFVFTEDNNDNNSDNNHTAPALADCQAQIDCNNGGTHIIARGVCSCICTNGFTGSSCEVEGAAGCTSTDLVIMGEDDDINDVTLGEALPRLIQEAQSNFTVPLMGTTILAKFNQEGLSCIAQNSLVTFDGRSTRTGSPGDEVVIDDESLQGSNGGTELQAGFGTVAAITVPPVQASTILSGTVTVTTTITSFPTPSVSLPGPTATTTSNGGLTVPTPTAAFSVTEEVLDFSRVAILFFLQERNLRTAASAQTTLQRFLAQASRSQEGGRDGVTQQFASNLTLANGVSVDLVNFRVNVPDMPDNPDSSQKRWVAPSEVTHLERASWYSRQMRGFPRHRHPQ